MALLFNHTILDFLLRRMLASSNIAATLSFIIPLQQFEKGIHYMSNSQ